MKKLKEKDIVIIISVIAIFFILSIIISASILTNKIINKNNNKKDKEKYEIKVHIDYEKNLIFNKYNIEMSLDGNKEQLPHGESGDYIFKVKEGSYYIYFKKEDDNGVSNKRKINVDENLNLGYKLKSHSDSIDVEKLYEYKELEVSVEEVQIDFENDYYKEMKYKKAKKELEEKGFTNITTKPVYDIELGFTEEETVKSITINGSKDYKRGDVVVKDAKVVIKYHMKKEDDPNKETTQSSITPETTTKIPNPSDSTYVPGYTTNTSTKAKEGNSGKFAYKKSYNYDVYWIIDFDNNCVYFFTEGNGTDTVDKLKIVSGTLNDSVNITWHDGNESAVWNLYFKYKNFPDKLVVNDHNGYTTEFITTNLKNAEKIMNNKRIIEN